MATQLSAETKKEITDLIADALRPLRSELDLVAREQKTIKDTQDTLNIQIKDIRNEIKTLFGQSNSLTSSLKLLENEVSKWRI